METITIIYPDGREETVHHPTRLRSGETVSTATGDYRVGFVRRRYAEPIATAYLSHPPDVTALHKLVSFDVDGATFSLTLPEAAELAHRLRLMAGGIVGSPTTAAAVR